MDNEREIKELKEKVRDLKQKVDDLYSEVGFPEQVMNGLTRNGFFRVRETLPTTFPTVDGYDITTYYQFGRLQERDVVFSNLGQDTFTQITKTSSSTNTFTANNHGLGNGNPVTFRTTGTPPDPLLSGGLYYIANSTTNTFQLSADSSGSPVVNLTDNGLGRHFLQKVIVTF